MLKWSVLIGVTSLNDEPELDLSVFDVLRKMFGDGFATAIASYNKCGKENVSRIEVAIENGDADELMHAGHSLKGASGQFGAMALSDLAEQMECFGKEGDIEKAKGIFDKLRAAREKAEILMNEGMA